MTWEPGYREVPATDPPDYQPDEDHECREFVIADGTAVLACWLEADHGGPHYDEADDLTWERGKPNVV